jgi:Chaperone of endosialidase
MEALMSSQAIRRVTIAAGMIILLNIAPSFGQGVNPTVSDNNSNTAGGTSALAGSLNLNKGAANTAFGATALSVATGDANSAFGQNALLGNTTGSSNTASGTNALFENTTGGANAAFGAEALGLNTTGNNNTACGTDALFANGTGSLNTAAGFLALANNVAGLENTAIGAKALKKSTGTKNIGIGFQAGVTLSEGDNNIYIGNQGAGVESQTIRIGTAQAQTFIAGIANASVGNAATVTIDTTTGQLGIPLSSARYKQDIAPMGTSSEGVLNLRPVTFAYKEDAQRVKHYGLVAEEVEKIYPELVTHAPTGEAQTVKYYELIPMLLNELQRVRQELAELRAQGQRRGVAVSQ